MHPLEAASTELKRLVKGEGFLELLVTVFITSGVEAVGTLTHPFTTHGNIGGMIFPPRAHPPTLHDRGC
jgi:hypothetical protein